MMHLALAVVLLQQPSEAAKKAKADLETLSKSLEQLNADFNAKAKGWEDDFKKAQAAGDAAKCAEIQKGFMAEREKAIGEQKKQVDVYLKGVNAAIAADPKDAELLEQRIKVRLMVNDTEALLADVAAAAALRPQEATIVDRAGRYFFQVGRFRDAKPYFESLVKLDAKNAEAGAMKACCEYWLLHWTEKFDEAAAALKAVDLAPLQRGLAGLVAQLSTQATTYVEAWKKEKDIRTREAMSDDLPRVKLTTSKGEIELELFENEAPNTTANFISLIESKFFDGIKFHRVLPDFMIQGGDPLSKDDNPDNDGTGGPGYKFNDELEAKSMRTHFRGSISMANSGPHTNGSQFFITHVPTAHLNGKHTCFGRVLKGLEVVDKIEKGDTIVKAEVIRKRAHEYKPKTSP